MSVKEVTTIVYSQDFKCVLTRPYVYTAEASDNSSIVKTSNGYHYSKDVSMDITSHFCDECMFMKLSLYMDFNRIINSY